MANFHARVAMEAARAVEDAAAAEELTAAEAALAGLDEAVRQLEPELSSLRRKDAP